MENSNIYRKLDIFALIQSTNAFFVCVTKQYVNHISLCQLKVATKESSI